MTDPRARIPSIDAVLGTPAGQSLVERFGRPRTLEALRAVVEGVRREVGNEGGEDRLEAPVAAPELYTGRAEARLEAAEVPGLRRVINATGVVLHTNLGRAPLPKEVADAMASAAQGYTNLEFDLDSGARGSRYTHCSNLLREMSGAEDALVVNNAAAALMLAVNTVAQGSPIVVSRGELVEIGGGFRIPEVMERAGAALMAVGSTNRTRVGDYADALREGGATALLKVHRSNFRMTGFTEEVEVEELATLAAEHALPLIHDLGSGLWIDPERLGLPREPRASDSLRAGADVVVVSGDKLLGGPQAGIVLGGAHWVSAMRRNPLCRALRVDKVTLAGLEATLRIYRDPDAACRSVPTLRMLSTSEAELRERAEHFASELHGEGGETNAAFDAVSVPTEGAVGGGTFPEVRLPSFAVAVTGVQSPSRVAARLRAGNPPVVARVEDDRLLFDMRTIAPGEEDELRREVIAALRDVPIGS